MPADSPTPAPLQPSPHAVEVSVVVSASKVFRGSIQHVTTQRVEVLLSDTPAPAFSGPQLVVLVFRARGGGEVAAVAHWVTRERAPGGAPILVCLLTDPARGPERGQPPEVGKIRRRDAYRVQASTPEEVAVTILPFVDPQRSLARQLADLRLRGERDVVRGDLTDISLGGAGIRVGNDGRWPYSFAQLVLLSIELPRRLEPLHVPAVILRRIDSGEGVLYGVSFVALTACPFEPLEREISQYVMDRQRRDLRYGAG